MCCVCVRCVVITTSLAGLRSENPTAIGKYILRESQQITPCSFSKPFKPTLHYIFYKHLYLSKSEFFRLCIFAVLCGRGIFTAPFLHSSGRDGAVFIPCSPIDCSTLRTHDNSKCSQAIQHRPGLRHNLDILDRFNMMRCIVRN